MSDRLHEYFAAEATEYLDRLEQLLSTPGPPDLEQLLRLARGVRGSAQMAEADTLVAVAERLESGLRSVQAEHVTWSEELRALSAGTVADLKVLARASSRWGREEEARVRQALERWDSSDRSEGSLATPAVVDVATLFYDDEGPHILTPDQPETTKSMNNGGAAGPVPIETLLLDRDGALREALAMRQEIEQALRSDGGNGALQQAVGELFELIEYAAGRGSAEG
jgi:chemotaxis protein histidine kinase CheA